MSEKKGPIDPSVEILIVDDLPQARRVVRLLLKKLGLENVKEAQGTSEAQALIASDGPPDLIIADVMLKDGTGLDLVRWVRENEDIKELPVIVITSDAEREHVVEGAKLNIAGFLLKPFDLTMLSEKLENALY